MLKNNLNFKLVNICLICLIVYLICISGNTWIEIFSFIKKIFLPIVLSFSASYAVYPIISFFTSRNLNKNISILLVLALFIGVVVLMIVLLIPLLKIQLKELFFQTITLLDNLSSKYNINFDVVYKYINNNFMNISSYTFKYINLILNYLSSFLIFISIFIYLLVDMDNIRDKVRNILYNKSIKVYNLFNNIDDKLKKYFSGFFKIIIITLIEYSLSFLVIGHPNFLLIGVMAAIGSFIPCFGGIMVNIFAALLALTIGKDLFIKTVILFIILSFLDSYLINPYVYGKTNELHPVITIFAVSAGGTLFGILGIVLSLPITIIIIEIFSFFKSDIYDKINTKNFSKR